MYRLLIISIVVFLLSTETTAQSRHFAANLLPAATKAHFNKHYKGSEDVSWTVLDRLIAVSFRVDDHYKEAYYTPDGKWIRTETETEMSLLPEPVKKAIKSKEFKGWQPGSAYILDLPGNRHQYKIFIYSTDWKELGLLFDEKGRRLADNL